MTSTRPSLTSRRPSGSIRSMLRRITTGAVAYGRKGELDKAIADYTEAIRLDPKHAQAYYDRGGAYKRRATSTRPSRTALRPSDSTRNMPLRTAAGALPTGRRATTTRPSPTTPRPSGSTRSMPRRITTEALPTEEGRTRQGHRRLHRGHPARPERRRRRATRGNAYSKKSELDKGIADYTEAIRLDPKYA